MDTMTLPISPKNPLKRTYNDARLDNHLPENFKSSAGIGDQTESAPGTDKQQSPVPKETAPLITMSTSAQPTFQSSTAMVATDPSALSSSTPVNPAKKKTKLKESEKEGKRLEKEAKEQEKAKQRAKKEEDRIRKEEEKAKKEDERRVRDAEKEQKRQEKEEQIKLKEEEKRKKEEERDKKAKSQLRLNAFFAPPSLTNDGPTTSLPHESPSPANSRRSSISSFHDAGTSARERSVSATPSKSKLSDYARRFPSFFLHSYTTLAPPSRFERDEEALQYTRRTIDEGLSNSSSKDFHTAFDPNEMLHLSRFKRRKLNCPQPRVKDIVERLHGTSENPIDLTESQRIQASHEPLDLLHAISTRFLKFAEDVRPPYIGTFTKLQDPTTGRRICRNPFTRGLPDADYDYDSEAEWEEPGEGEDLDSEGEEENESEDGDDLEGFLDDEDAADSAKALQKRRLVTGNLEPTSSGIGWEDKNNFQAVRDLEQYRLEVILENPYSPIDPYSTTYWQTASTTMVSGPSVTGTSQSVMDPPRIPLTTINRTNLLLLPNPASAPNGLKPPITAQTMQPPRAPKAAKRMVAPEVLEDFKRAVDGSDLTKAGLIEILKKQFPKQSKDAIKDTLGMIAERVGAREKDKRWVVK